MKNNIKILLRFSGVLLSILLITFALQLHFSRVESNLYLSLLFKTYSVNYVLAILIFHLLLYLKLKHTHLLGFVYMGGSLVKFAVYFIFFNPIFKIDGSIDKMEAFSFLIPYFISLILETTYLIKLINK